MSATGTRMSEIVKDLLRDGASYADGRWLGNGGQVLEVVDPATEETLVSLPKATRADVDAAVAAARRAFDSGPWPRMSPRERSQALQRLADCVVARSEALAEIGSLDVGSPITLS